jgi:periplasmic copper chaperone A
MKPTSKFLLAATAAFIVAPALAQQHASHAAAAAAPAPGASAQAAAVPSVAGAWVRTAVAGQSGTGAFMRLTAPRDLQLVGVATPVAGLAQVHEMRMEGDVMKMRAVDKLDLPAGKPVELKPGGYHLMLMQLKRPLASGATVPLTLTFRDAQGARSQLTLQLPVAAKPPGGGAAPMDGHKH